MSRYQNLLDRQVYEVVLTLGEISSNVSAAAVYDHIQHSNSSLKRTKKKLLEASIDRALEDLQDVSDVSENNRESNQAPLPEVQSDIMNKHMRNSLRKAHGHQPSSNATTRSPPREAVDTSSRKRSAPRSSKDSRLPKRPKAIESSIEPPPTSNLLHKIGGMDKVIAELEKLILLPLRRPQAFTKVGVDFPRGILLHGPPGCGKTMLCEAIAAEIGLPWLPILGPSIVSGMSGESEKALRQHFEAAVESAPCLVFIDEIDSFTPKRETAQREMERRIVGQLLTCMDTLSLEKTGGRPVIVLATTNRPDSIDPALRRAGRFEREINIGVPNEMTRQSILEGITSGVKLSPDVDLKELAKMTPGFVGADLRSLISLAAQVTFDRYIGAIKDMANNALPLSESASKTVLSNSDEGATMSVDESRLDNLGQLTSSASAEHSKASQSFSDMDRLLLSDREPAGVDLQISRSDLIAALSSVQPSAKREGFTTIPDTKWTDVGALSTVRQQLHDAIVSPIQNPELYERFHIKVPAGVLLCGPPGCGKTLVAKAVANESKANFISVKGPELLNKYVGESERAVRQVFTRASSSVPCVIFFDEMDALVPRRDDTLSEASARVVNTLLTELDGLNDRGEIYVIAATNRPEMIDSAMLRPGRLGKLLYVGLPSPDERVEILCTILRKMPTRNGEADRAELSRVAIALDKFSGADLASLAHDAAQRAVKRASLFLELEDLIAAASAVKPSVSSADEARYRKFVERHGPSFE